MKGPNVFIDIYTGVTVTNLQGSDHLINTGKRDEQMHENMKEYISEKEAREKRLAVYTEKIQETVLNKSAEIIRFLVEERHAQKMTQQEISDITGIQPSNLARFESGGRVPTLVVLEKYANALGKHIEIKICDD